MYFKGFLKINLNKVINLSVLIENLMTKMKMLEVREHIFVDTFKQDE